MEKVFQAIGAIVTAFFLVFLVCIFMCFPLMWCWNAVMPYLFGMKMLISWQQSWCLMFVSGILLKQPAASSK